MLAALRLEIEFDGRQLFSLSQEEVAAGLEIKMEALDEGQTLGCGEVREDVHAEDAIETAEVDRAAKVRLREGNQVPQSRLDQVVLTNAGEIALDQPRRNSCQSSLRVEPTFGMGEGTLAD